MKRQVVMSCIEQDVILITKPRDGVAVRIRSAFPRFQVSVPHYCKRH
jgi:hypothetical protein